MYNIIAKKNLWFSLSGILSIISLVALLIWGLKLSIDFTGGSLLEVAYQPSRPSVEKITEILQPLNLESLRVQPSGDNEFFVRFESVDEPRHQEILGVLKNVQFDNQTLQGQELKFESIGPTIGNELKSKAVQAIVLVLILIIAYIAYAFRHVSKPVASWKYGVAAVIALFHDIFVVIGIYAILGHFLNVEVDILFVTALLTILGFSVHDTIVTFDRTRENLFKIKGQSFEEIVNLSVNETIVRSLNTSLTTLFALLAVYIFGGESIRYFVLALILGVIIGTYSSIFIASPLVVLWNSEKS
ncbi:MAG: Protein translocase subunit SecF [Parcubacteria group bacterium GW2011_GWA2_36_10]|nr:MAG: Protein translocase subunit SecF [Parcubacteria group bacterium GW2011_GWA2_36_10]